MMYPRKFIPILALALLETCFLARAQRVIETVDTVTELLTRNMDNKNTVYVTKGLSTVGDGGGGEFYYKAGDASAANGGTVFTVTGGRLLRRYEGALLPQWFGAAGDGSTNDTAAIQAVHDAAPVGGAVYLPKGTYLMSGGPLQITKAVTLYGEGTLKYPDEATTYALILVKSTATNVRIQGLSFDGNRTNQTVWSEFRHCITLEDTAHVQIQNCRFSNLIGDGIYCGVTYGAAAPFVGVSDISITGCHFTGDNSNRNGISVVCGQRIRISDCTIRGMATAVMPGAIDFEPDSVDGFVRDVTVTGNTIEGCRAGVLVMNNQNVASSNFCGFTISDNTITHTTGATTDGGIRIYHGSDATISGNTVSGVTNGYAINVWGDNISVVSNNGRDVQNAVAGAYVPALRLIGNGWTNIAGTGFSLVGCSNAVVTANTIKAWPTGEVAINLTNCPAFSVFDNVFDGGTTNAIAAVQISTDSSSGIGIGNQFPNCTVEWTSPSGTFRDNFTPRFYSQLGLNVGGVLDRRGTGSPFLCIEANSPSLSFWNTAASTNNRLWTIIASGHNFQLRSADDAAGVESTPLTISRVGALPYDAEWTLNNDFTINALRFWVPSAAVYFSSLTVSNDLTMPYMTANRLLVTDGSKKVISGAATTTEAGYLSGVTAPIQSQLNSRQNGATILTNFSGLSGTGFVVATGSGGVTNRVLSAGTGISISNTNGVSGDPVINSAETVKVTTADTSGGYLSDKIVAGSNITITTNNAGGAEQLVIASSGGGGGGGATNYVFESPLTTYNVTNVYIATGGIVDSLLRPGAARSVIGRKFSTGGQVADIVANADNTFLGRFGGELSFAALPDDLSNQKVNIMKNGVSVGTRKTVNLIEGTGTTMTVADNGGDNRVDVTINSALSTLTGASTTLTPNVLMFLSNVWPYNSENEVWEQLLFGGVEVFQSASLSAGTYLVSVYCSTLAWSGEDQGWFKLRAYNGVSYTDVGSPRYRPIQVDGLIVSWSEVVTLSETSTIEVWAWHSSGDSGGNLAIESTGALMSWVKLN